MYAIDSCVCVCVCICSMLVVCQMLLCTVTAGRMSRNNFWDDSWNERNESQKILSRELIQWQNIQVSKMEKLDLCRLCLANSMNASMLPSTKTMERTMRQFNMLYSVSGVHFLLSNRHSRLQMDSPCFAESRFHCWWFEVCVRTVLGPNRWLSTILDACRRHSHQLR